MWYVPILYTRPVVHYNIIPIHEEGLSDALQCIRIYIEYSSQQGLRAHTKKDNMYNIIYKKRRQRFIMSSRKRKCVYKRSRKIFKDFCIFCVCVLYYYTYNIEDERYIEWRSESYGKKMFLNYLFLYMI